MGLMQADLTPLAEKAAKDHCSATNPKPLTVADCAALYQMALN
jgi:alcohol dehydrogenase class IV